MNILNLISITIIFAIGLIAIDKQKEGTNRFLKACNLTITKSLLCGGCIGIVAGCVIWVTSHPPLIPFLLSLTK